jgi:hypothetical protein
VKRFVSIAAVAGFMTAGGAAALITGSAGAKSARTAVAPPTLNIALTGTRGVSVSGSTASGAVNVVSTFKGKQPSNGAAFALARLNPGVSLQQAFRAVQSHRGNMDALTPYGAIVVDSSSPGTVQTVLTPGNWVALNVSSENGPPGFKEFTVTQSSSPAALAAASSTQKAVEFAFQGPTVLHSGTMVRAVNAGYLVHMIQLVGVKSRTAGLTLLKVLKVHSSRKAARPFLNGQFASLQAPVSPGGMQQSVLHAKPGWYLEACFMDTQDGREHVQLGMERLVKVVK